MAKARVPSATRDRPAQGAWTYEDWLALPDDGSRYEVIDGALHVTPPPSIAHQAVIGQLFLALTTFARSRRLGRVFFAPIGVLLPGQPVPLEPDLVFVSAARSDIIEAQYIVGAPDLVAEVLSPGSRSYDRRKKRRVYEAAGVPEYWLLDYAARTVEVLALRDGTYSPAGEWGPGESARSEVLAGFVVAVDDIFRDV
jgi:Uma2 family endonuclease